MRAAALAVGHVPTPARAVRVARNTAVWQVAAFGGFLTTGVALWVLSLSSIPLDEMTDLGLGSVLPPGIWIGIGLVTVACAIAWRAASVPMMALGVLATIVVLHGLGVLGEPTMRFATAWQHVGIADYIATHGAVDPNIDAYFNWPGFFILGAFITKTLGIDNIEPIARYAPLFYNALYVLPLAAIGRSLFVDRRTVWLGIWLFFVCNWIGQDYFSPQGFGIFLYLVLIAVVLRWFKGVPRAASSDGRRWSRFTQRAWIVADTPSTPIQRVVLIAAILLIALAVVASHQLTPFALVTATLALRLVGWDRLRTLPVALLLMTMLWASYMAVTYLAGHIGDLTGDVGQVNDTVNVSVNGRITGSSGHEAIVKLRLIVMAGFWGIAMLAFLRQAIRRELTLGLFALAFAPFPLLALQSYGGEVVLRIALFSLPFMAFAAATLFVPADRAKPIRSLASVGLACFAVVLLAAFPFTRYGNERMDYYSKAELDATNALYKLAPQGSALFAASWALPWRYQHYADYYYYSSLTDGKPQLDFDEPDPQRLSAAVAARMREAQEPNAFLVIAKSTAAQTDLFGPFKKGSQDRLRRILMTAPEFRVIYTNPDATVFQLR